MTEKVEISHTESTEKENDSQPQDLAGGTESQAGRSEVAVEKDGQAAPTEIPVDKATPEQLREKLAAAEVQAADNLDGWQRSQADFQNYKRRMERELEQARKNAAAGILGRFLPVVDDLELALDSLPASLDGAKWSEGINLVHRKLLMLLEVENIAPIEAAPGQPFDPNFHEAILQEENADFEEGVIIAVLRRGYQLGEYVLRPAQVRVAK